MRIKHILTKFDVECLEVRIKDCIFFGDRDKAIELVEFKTASYHANTNERGLGWRLIVNTGDNNEA
jgi:hypothetical protein